jgi:hypothetical protein
MTKSTWLKGAALVLIAVLALAGCQRRTEAQEGGSGTGAAPVVREAPASDFTHRFDAQGVTITSYSGNGGAIVVIPSVIDDMPVVAIGRRAFRERKFIGELVVPESVTTIGDEAFSRALINKVTLPDGLKVIPHQAFSGSYMLKTVNFPTSLEEIGALAFRSCTALTELIIPDSLNSLRWSGAPNNHAFSVTGKIPLVTRERLQALGYPNEF